MIAAALVAALAALPARADAADADPRIAHVHDWLDAAVNHTPRANDASVDVVGSWSGVGLELLQIDLRVIVVLMRNPAVASFTIDNATGSVPSFVVSPQAPRRLSYTANQLRHFRAVACAAAGMLRDKKCKELAGTLATDDRLVEISDIAAAAREAGDPHYMIRRAALLHADVAMAGLPLVASGNNPFGTRSVTVDFSDGQQTGVSEGVVHWGIARRLLDAIEPAPDPMVRRWYVATAAWMQMVNRHDLDHLERALKLFPDDGDLLFFAACEHETNAMPGVQAALRSMSLPNGITIGVGTDKHELGEAERLFRRSLTVTPDRTEARIRLGRVLLLRGDSGAAITELERAATTNDKSLRYFARLFLGAAHETAGHFDAARQSYQAAAAVFPRAQSPQLALSALARRLGDRSTALSQLDQLFAPRDIFVDDDNDDPWWTYDRSAGRDADDLLDALTAPFVELPR